MYYISHVCGWRNEKVFTHFETFDNADFFNQKALVGTHCRYFKLAYSFCLAETPKFT